MRSWPESWVGIRPNGTPAWVVCQPKSTPRRNAAAASIGRPTRALLQEIDDRRLRVGRIGGRISVDLPGASRGFSVAARHPLADRVVRFVQAVVWSAVHGDGGFASWRFGGVHFAGGFKCARDFDAEVTHVWVMVEEDVVAVGPQAGLASQERPDLVQCGF